MLSAAFTFGFAVACFLHNKPAKLMKNEKKKKGQPKKVSTCFDGSSAAEMIQKIMGEQRIGSLCEEMMRSLLNKLDEDIEESLKTKKEEI
jgi:hypothetical protein